MRESYSADRRDGMTIDEMQARRDQIDQEILDYRQDIENLKHEFNRLGNEIERLQQAQLDDITGRSM